MSVFEKKVSAAECVRAGKPYATTIHAIADGETISLPAVRTSFFAGDLLEAVYSAAAPAGVLTKVGLGTSDGCVAVKEGTIALESTTELRVKVSVPRPAGMPKRINPLAVALTGGACAFDTEAPGRVGETLTFSGETVLCDGVLCLENARPVVEVSSSGKRTTTYAKPENVSSDPIFSATFRPVPDWELMTGEGLRYRTATHVVETLGYRMAEYNVIAVDSADGEPCILANRGIVLPFENTVVSADPTGFRAFRAIRQAGETRFVLLTDNGLKIFGKDGSVLAQSDGDYERLAVGGDFVMAHKGTEGVWYGDDFSRMNIHYIEELLRGDGGKEGFASYAYYRYDAAKGTGIRLDLELNATTEIYADGASISDTDGRTLAYASGDALIVKDLLTGETYHRAPGVGAIERIAVTGSGLFVSGREGAAVARPESYQAYTRGAAFRIYGDPLPTTVATEVEHVL